MKTCFRMIWSLLQAGFNKFWQLFVMLPEKEPETTGPEKVRQIAVEWSAAALTAFLDGPYWAVSDVKMLYFFTRMSVTTMIVMAMLAVLSILYVNFWCRYLYR